MQAAHGLWGSLLRFSGFLPIILLKEAAGRLQKLPEKETTNKETTKKKLQKRNCKTDLKSKRNKFSAGRLVRCTVGWCEREVTLAMSGRKERQRIMKLHSVM